MWEGMTAVRECDSPKEACQLVGRRDVNGEK